jgi:hypothetical protein
LGVGLDVVRTGSFAATIYVDGLALRHDLHRHYGSDLVEHARWIGGFDVLGSASFGFTDTLAIFASGGLELGFGETKVFLGDAEVAAVPRVRGLVLAGIRLRF